MSTSSVFIVCVDLHLTCFISNVRSRKVLEVEKREEGLQKTIGAENKGFALLSKMGYKPGMGIGKEGKLTKYACMCRDTILMKICDCRLNYF